MLRTILTKLEHLMAYLLAPTLLAFSFFAGNYTVYSVNNYIANWQADLLDQRLLAYAKAHPDPNLPEGVNYPPAVMNIHDITGEGMPEPHTLIDKAVQLIAPDILFSHNPNEDFYSFQYIPLQADGSEWNVNSPTPPTYYNLEYFVVSPMGGNVYRHVSNGSYQRITESNE